MNEKLLAILAFLALPMLFACGTGDQEPESTGGDVRSPAVRKKVDPALLVPSSFDEKAPEVYRARFETTAGDFVIEVDRSWAPEAADRFFNLVQAGFFDDTTFFRVEPGFVVQFGLCGVPRVDQAWQRATLPDDFVTRNNLKGRVTFARTAEPNSRTTQVFINLADNTKNLNERQKGFAPFGQVVSGMDVVEDIYSGYQPEPPDQARIVTVGDDYLRREFPDLTRIKTASIE